MTTLHIVAIGIVALLHVYFMVLEMFLWTKPTGLRVFGLTPETAEASKVLAKNQGLYNGIFAATLLWSIYAGHDGWHFAIFFLTMVIIAGIYGALTANKKIFFVQALPAILALVALHIR